MKKGLGSLRTKEVSDEDLCPKQKREEDVETRVRKCLSSTKSRLKHLEERKEKLNTQEKQNDQWLQQTQNDLRMLDSGNCSVDAISFLDVYEKSCSNELLAKGLKQECKYYKKCTQNYESQRKREKRLIQALLKCVRNQYVVLKSLALNTDEINTDYENIINIVEDAREVAWADEMVASGDQELDPIDVIKNVENNLSLMKTSTATPSRTPSTRPLWKSSNIDMTPIRLNTPSLKLSSTLWPSACKNQTPAKTVRGSYVLDSTETVSHCKSPRPVRLNLMNVLNQDRSSPRSSGGEINSTNMRFSALDITQVSSTKDVPALAANQQNTSSFVDQKSVVSKRCQLKPSTIVNKNIGLPVRVVPARNLDVSDTRPKSNSISGGENGKRIPGYASLTKSAAQKITAGRDLLPKRSRSKENTTLPQPKRRKLPRSVSSSSLISDEQSKKQERHKNHVSGLKRAVSVINMRK